MSVFSNYRVVTLLELLRHNAEAFCRLSSIIGQAIILLDFRRIEDLSELVANLGELDREIKRLGLPSASKQLDRIRVAITTAGTEINSIKSLILDLHIRIQDDLSDRVFIAIPVEITGLYKQDEPAFGTLVDDTFPHAAEDIGEAAKCLALGRSTAVVFHLMRAMERAVVKLSDNLGVDLLKKDGSEKEWGSLLKGYQAKIDELPSSDRPKWRESYVLLHSVKSAWRNDTMHPKQTYTFEEAHRIYSAVKEFMNDLAPLVS